MYIQFCASVTHLKEVRALVDVGICVGLRITRKLFSHLLHRERQGFEGGGEDRTEWGAGGIKDLRGEGRGRGLDRTEGGAGGVRDYKPVSG